MKFIFLVLFLFFSLPAFTQIKQFNIPMNQKQDTSYWYKWKNEILAEAGLDNILQSFQKEHFRIWLNGQIIEVWKDSINQVAGKIVCFVEEYTPYEEEPTNRHFTIPQALNPEQAQKMWEWINTSQINTIPSEEYIKEWSNGLDGITYMIETVENEQYAFKSYWTPTAQDLLKEAIAVQDFIDKASEICNLKNHWKFGSVQAVMLIGLLVEL